MIKDNYTHKSIVLSRIGSILPIGSLILSILIGPFILTKLNVFEPIYIFLINSSIVSFISSSTGIIYFVKSKQRKKESLVLGILGIFFSVLLLLFAFWMNIVFGYKW